MRRAHRSATNKRDADRIKAAYLLSRGKSTREIAVVLMLDEDTVGHYRKRYEVGGIAALLKDAYLDSKPMLSCAEIEKLAKPLEAQTYLTVESIVEYVNQIYQVNYSISGMRHLLHRLNFVYKKAKAVPGKANAELQQRYLAMLEKILVEKGGVIVKSGVKH